MATTTWTGAASGDFAAAGNWTGVKPGTGDTGIFNGTSSVSVDTNADGQTAVDIGEIIVEPSYSGDLGDSGTPLAFSCGKFTFQGSGELFYNNGSTFITDDMIIDTQSGSVQLGDNSGGGGITRIALLACRDATLLSTLDTTTDLFIGSGVSVKIQGSNTIANVHAASGAQVNCTAVITNLFADGCRWVQMASGGLITNMYLHSSTVIKYLSTGTITYAVVLPGALLDFTGDAREKTLTTARVFPGGMLKRTNAISPTITNGGTLRSVLTIS